MDFEKEVLPELGPECGAVMIELPDAGFKGATGAAFCKLKSNKLSEALSTGKLFTDIGPTNDVAEVKVGKDSSSLRFATGSWLFRTVVMV